MATHVWDDETEADVWMIEPGFSSKDTGLSSTYSSDSETTASSAETIQSIEAADYFRIEHGRAFPIYDNLPMSLPTDQGEMRRLKIQHMAIKKLVGDALDCLVEAHLAPSPDGRRKQVLDIRTQSGIWADEMAIKYPAVDIKSIDVAPTVAHYPRHNLHYEVYDIHAGVLEQTGAFDIVNATHTVDMTKDWTSLLQEMHRVLRPGGLLIFGEWCPRLTLPGEDKPALHGPAHHSARFMEMYRSAIAASGVLLEVNSKIDGWLRPDSGLWPAQTHSGFYDIVHEVRESPLNSLWHLDPKMQEIGMLSAMNFCEFVASAQPLLLSYGISETEYEEWVEDIRREIRDPLNSAVIKYHFVTAFKL
ncbi:unnamed protein product [Rhizoctonia solani]|uniref:Methyltransferase type 11 domain-containing protein n=1 Tax=Rhizoctonia solani TaxID=456999 RepID=A0A8H3A033_9AGAM|nr:unnamed protein product [Rhizoctonia solani]